MKMMQRWAIVQTTLGSAQTKVRRISNREPKSRVDTRLFVTWIIMPPARLRAARTVCPLWVQMSHFPVAAFPTFRGPFLRHTLNPTSTCRPIYLARPAVGH